MLITLIMGIFNLFASPDLSYKEFEKWVDSSLNTELPKDVVAFCFNLYDDGNGQWSVELVGTSSFDKDDSDWACNEVFDTRNNPLKWKSKESWKKVLSSVRSHLETYLKNGKHASLCAVSATATRELISRILRSSLLRTKPLATS